MTTSVGNDPDLSDDKKEACATPSEPIGNTAESNNSKTSLPGKGTGGGGEIVRTLRSNDILCGRGHLQTEWRGNKRLRQLVADYRSDYAGSNTHKNKQQIALAILSTVHDAQGGRFLRRIDSPQQSQPSLANLKDDKEDKSPSEQHHQQSSTTTTTDESVQSVTWQVIDDRKVLINKIKQMMRDVGPETRRKRKLRKRKRKPEESQPPPPSPPPRGASSTEGSQSRINASPTLGQRLGSQTNSLLALHAYPQPNAQGMLPHTRAAAFAPPATTTVVMTPRPPLSDPSTISTPLLEQLLPNQRDRHEATSRLRSLSASLVSRQPSPEERLLQQLRLGSFQTGILQPSPPMAPLPFSTPVAAARPLPARSPDPLQTLAVQQALGTLLRQQQQQQQQQTPSVQIPSQSLEELLRHRHDLSGLFNRSSRPS